MTYGNLNSTSKNLMIGEQMYKLLVNMTFHEITKRFIKIHNGLKWALNGVLLHASFDVYNNIELIIHCMTLTCKH
jgi:hypothetical protein